MAGIGVGLFLVWQLWWTDVVALRHQHSLVEGLHRDAAATGKGTHHTTTPSSAVEPAEGSVFATMQIPRFGADYNRAIGQGTGREEVLNTIGLGHYPGTAMPGGLGNFAVAGHRVTYGKPLNQIAELQPGDALVVRAPDAKGIDTWYVYKVTDSQIVTPEHIETIAPVPNKPDAAPDDRYITLTACHPMWSAKERFITHGKLAYAMPASDGTPVELTSAPAPASAPADGGQS